MDESPPDRKVPARKQARRTHVSTWSINELRRIAEMDDLHISPFRDDGKA
jgi:hypothetical protein